MALTEIPIELSSTPSIVDGGNATAITISSAELVTVANGLTLTDGNVVVAAGHGIDFSAQTATSASGASTTAELLDHYEEGTFTPTLASNFTGNYSVNSGSYTKVGNIVQFSMYLAVSASGGSGNLVVEGLPFASGSGTPRNHAYQGWTNSFASNGVIQFLLGPALTTFGVYTIPSSGAVSISQLSHIGAAGNFILSGTYTTG